MHVYMFVIYDFHSAGKVILLQVCVCVRVSEHATAVRVHIHSVYLRCLHRELSMCGGIEHTI